MTTFVNDAEGVEMELVNEQTWLSREEHNEFCEEVDVTADQGVEAEGGFGFGFGTRPAEGSPLAGYVEGIEDEAASGGRGDDEWSDFIASSCDGLRRHMMETGNWTIGAGAKSGDWVQPKAA